jgi:hypothetical protein
VEDSLEMIFLGQRAEAVGASVMAVGKVCAWGNSFQTDSEIVCNLIEMEGFLIEEAIYKILYIFIWEIEKWIFL